MSTEQTEALEYVTVKVNLPDGHHVEFAAGKSETMFELKQTLREVPATQSFTAYHLTRSGQILSESESLEAFDNETVSMDLVPAAYTETTAREHVNIVRKIAALDVSKLPIYQIAGEAAGASSWNTLHLADIKEPEAESEAEAKTETSEEKTVELSPEEKEEASNILSEILAIGDEVSPFASQKEDYLKKAVVSLALSAWNPVTTSRRVNGDLFYLTVQTLENEILNITAHVTGFFVNSSSSNRFDPSLKVSGGKSHKNYSLLDLLKTISPLFEKQVIDNDEVISSVSRELLFNPENVLLANPWLVSPSKISPDFARSQIGYLQGGFDGSDLHKDWNREYQTIKDAALEEGSQLIKEQLFIERSSEFNIIAIQGALAVARGEVEPMNPEEPSHLWMYMRNGVFYSKPCDSLGHHAKSGGNEAARIAAARDVAAVKLLNRYDLPGVHCLLTTVVDYCGQRIICQAPVPGLFSDPSDQEAADISPQYGYTEAQNQLVTDEAIAESFKVVGEAFGIKPHKIWTEDGETVIDAYTSGYTKGLYGSDGKKYAIDLFRTTPLDIEFIESHVDFSKEDSYPHKEASLRREAVTEWVKRETAVAIRKQTEKLEHEGSTDSEKKTIAVDPSLFALNPDAFSLPKAPTAELASELKADEDAVRNVSEFVNKILIPEFIDEQAKAEDQNPIDGPHLSEALHAHGINLRYLGRIATLALEKKNKYLEERESKQQQIAKINETQLEKEAKKIETLKAKFEARYKAQKEAEQKGEPVPTFEDEKEEEQEEEELSSELSTIPTAALMDSLFALSLTEMIARGTKHYLRNLLSGVPIQFSSYVISHVFNCLLGYKANTDPKPIQVDSLLLSIYPEIDLSSLMVSAGEVHAAIAKEVFLRFRFLLPSDWVQSIRPLPLWRNISLKFGIQWIEKTYAFTEKDLISQVEKQKLAIEKIQNLEKNKKKGKKHKNCHDLTKIRDVTFTPDDIVAIVPIVKDSVYDSNTVSRIWANIASSTNDQTLPDELFANLRELIDCVEQLYGPVHRMTGLYMSRIASILSNLSQGSLFGRKAFQIFERICGGDSYQAALSLNQLVTIEVANNAPVNSLKLLKRSLEQWIVGHGQEHPNVITSLNTVFIIALNNGLKNECLALLKKVIDLSDKLYGEDSEESAIFKFRLSQILFEAGNPKEALPFAKNGYEVLLKTLGLLNKNTVDARTWANRLENYIIYKETEQKKSAKQVKDGKKAETVTEQSKKSIAKKSKSITPNPELAGKSVEDILAFINGPATSSKKSRKNN